MPIKRKNYELTPSDPSTSSNRNFTDPFTIPDPFYTFVGKKITLELQVAKRTYSNSSPFTVTNVTQIDSPQITTPPPPFLTPSTKPAALTITTPRKRHLKRKKNGFSAPQLGNLTAMVEGGNINFRPLLRTLAKGATVALGGILISSTAITLFTQHNKNQFGSPSLLIKKKNASSCDVCRGKGFYMCKLCKGNGTIEWSPLYDPVFINPCLCPTCDGHRIQRCLNCLGSGYIQQA